MRHNLTLTYGLRWGTSTPVYEVNGFQTQPTTSLGEYFEKRKAGAAAGVPFNDVISLDLSGKANGRPGFYHEDWNNFAPVVAVAWQPELPDNFWGKLIGREGRAVIRGGFRTTYDRIGSALAVNFDLSNQLGFASALTIPVNTYNVSTNLAPLFNGGVQDVRTLPGIAGNFNNTIAFPLLQPPNGAQRVETSLDDTLTTPVTTVLTSPMLVKSAEVSRSRWVTLAVSHETCSRKETSCTSTICAIRNQGRLSTKRCKP